MIDERPGGAAAATTQEPQMHEHATEPRGHATPGGSATGERRFAPADTLFTRLRHQSALLSAADTLDAVGGAAGGWGRLLREYTLASDRVVTVHGDADAATLGWLKPRGVVALLVTEECSDDHAVEHLAAALAAMNAVTLTTDGERSERLSLLVGTLARLLPDAFAELSVERQARYPAGAVAAVLTPDVLYRAWTPPAPLTGAARDDEERLALLTLYGRLRQLDVRPE